MWRRSQTWLRSEVAVVVALAGGYSSDSTSSLGTSIYHRCGPKKKKNPPNSVIKKNETMPFTTTGMDLEIIILSEVSQRRTNII